MQIDHLYAYCSPNSYQSQVKSFHILKHSIFIDSEKIRWLFLKTNLTRNHMMVYNIYIMLWLVATSVDESRYYSAYMWQHQFFCKEYLTVCWNSYPTDSLVSSYISLLGLLGKQVDVNLSFRKITTVVSNSRLNRN